MSESSTSSHPLILDLFAHRDSFSYHLKKVHFHIGGDPLLNLRVRAWIEICKRDLDSCKTLGCEILASGGGFLIGQKSANREAVDNLFNFRQEKVRHAEELNHTDWPHCRIVPGTLWWHENVDLRRHTITEHVGKSPQQLMERLKEQQNLRRASSFRDREIAETAIRGAIALFSRHIEQEFTRGEPEVILPPDGSFDAGVPLGIVMKRDGSIFESSRLKVILVKSNSSSLTFYVKTAYPTL